MESHTSPALPAPQARVRPFEISQDTHDRAGSQRPWVTARRKSAVLRLVAACGVLLVVIMLAELPWRGGRKRGSLSEIRAFGAAHGGIGREDYLRALTDIDQGEQLANSRRFMPAASEFLRAKDLWQKSGQNGWQTAQSLADAAVDR
jgi:hypothetical protein